MNPKKPRTGLRVLLLTLVMTPILLWSMSSSALYGPGSPERATENKLALSAAPAIPMPPPKADLDQVRNGSAASPIDPASWVNGNAGSSNSHYTEGQSIPYRIRLTNISLDDHTIDIEWDIKHSGKNAIDYITNVVRTPPQNVAEVINPCIDFTPCTNAPTVNPTGLGGFTTFQIPTPVPSQNVPPGPDAEPQTSFGALPAADKLFRIYNGVITNMFYVNNADGNLGDLTAAQSSTRLRIEFTAGHQNVVLAWGGHIASRNDWGFTGGVPNSAGGVSGSPYHTRLIAFDGSGGNQDRSLSAAAVSPPAECGIACNDPLDNCTTVCAGSAHVYKSSATQDPANTYSWSLTNNTSGASFGSATNAPTVTVNAGASGGGYTLNLTVGSAGGTTMCSMVVSVLPPTAITNGPTAGTACEGSAGPVNFSVTATGSNLHYVWKVNGVTTGTDSANLAFNPSALAPGSYPVTVDVTGDCGSASANTTLTINDATEISDPPDNAEACDDSHGPVNFSVTASGTGTLHYAWTVNNVAAGSDSPNLSYDPFALAPGSYPVKVVVTSDCGTDDATATLTINGLPSATLALTQECDAFSKLTATPSGGSGSGYGFSWTGPAGGIAADDGVCGPSRACILVTKTGTYTVTVTDSKSCSGAQEGDLCLSLSSQGPPNQVSQAVDMEARPQNVPVSTRLASTFLAGVTQFVLWLM